METEKENKDLEIEDFINSGVVTNEKNEVLLIRRVKKEIGKDGSVLTWAFPAGKQRLNESRKDGVKREILAETGYEVESIKQISIRYHPQFPVCIVYHLCRLVSPKPIARPSEPHEVAEIRWVKKEEIKNLITTDLDPEVSKELGLWLSFMLDTYNHREIKKDKEALEKFYKLTVGREFRMAELKQKIRELEEKLEQKENSDKIE